MSEERTKLETAQGAAQILVVDDEPMNIAVLGAMLESKGFLFDSATCGEAGLQLVRERSNHVREGHGQMYKLILLDYSMSDLDGPQVASAIREHFETSDWLCTRHRPYICCVTAYQEASFKNKAFSSGMDRFVSKPVSNDQL